MAERMTLDQFVERSGASIEAFAAATRRSQAEGEEGFVGPEYEARTEADWWREVSAYHEYVEACDRIAGSERRSLIERRKI